MLHLPALHGATAKTTQIWVYLFQTGLAKTQSLLV